MLVRQAEEARLVEGAADSSEHAAEHREPLAYCQCRRSRAERAGSRLARWLERNGIKPHMPSSTSGGPPDHRSKLPRLIPVAASSTVRRTPSGRRRALRGGRPATQ
jgi:hypothetical protein